MSSPASESVAPYVLGPTVRVDVYTCIGRRAVRNTQHRVCSLNREDAVAPVSGDSAAIVQRMWVKVGISRWIHFKISVLRDISVVCVIATR